MIPLFSGPRPQDRLGLSYNGIILNNPLDDKDDLYEIDRVRSKQQFESIVEPKSARDGLEVYTAFKRVRHIRMDGVVRAPSRGRLYDRIEALSAAVDPALLSHDNPDDAGFLPLDFSIPTADTVNFPTELMPCRYYVRPTEAMEPDVSRYQGTSIPFIIDFMAADPRRYLQATSIHAGDGAADNSLATYHSWPTISISMSGAGSATFEIANAAANRSLVIDLSGRVNGDSVTIDMEGRMVQVNGVDAPSLFVSGDYWWMEPGSNVLTITNGTNASVTTVWRAAFSY